VLKMASKCVTTVVAADQTVFTAPVNKVCRLTGIQISAPNGVGVITIKDTFTTTASNGAAAAIVTLTKKVINIDNAIIPNYSWTDEMKSIKILGKCEVINSGANAMDVTVMWE